MDAKRITTESESYWLTPDGVLDASDVTAPEPGDLQRFYAWNEDGYACDVVDASGRRVVLTAAEERWLDERGEEHRERMEQMHADFMECGNEW